MYHQHLRVVGSDENRLRLKGIGVGVSKLCDTYENSVQHVSSRTEIDSRLTSSGGEV